MQAGGEGLMNNFESSAGRWISPTFYAQLLHHRSIPKEQKDSLVKQLLALSESVRVKAARKHNDEIDPSRWISPTF